MRELNKIFDVKSREAQRAILDKFDISADDKNKVLNKIVSGGGGSDSNGINIEYYKVIDPENTNPIFNILILYSSCFLNCIHGEYSSNMHNHSIANNFLISSTDRYKILAIMFVNIKSVFDAGDGNPFTFEGSLQERADYIATIFNQDKININDYLEPITEEEFYNINS